MFDPNYSHIAVILSILLESIAIALLLTNIGSLSASFCTYMNFEAENMGLLCRCGLSPTLYLKVYRDDLQGHNHCLTHCYTTTPVLDSFSGVIDIYEFCGR